MNILLTAINAKYIHSNLAVYSLRAYADIYREQIRIAEFTINNQADDILSEIYKRKPDVLCFSCYIWNIDYVETIAREFHKLCPEVPIWLGGPEVSYETAAFLNKHPEITGLIVGEGEETFRELCEYYIIRPEGKKLSDIAGLALREGQTGVREIMDMSKIPFCYDNTEDFSNRIIYYESSRGCPFSCSYCLSSVDKKLRFRDVEMVKRELTFFIEQKVPQIKFVDRTFNCSHAHAMEIWQFIKEHDNGVTNFHFEISADLLNEEELNLLAGMRPGLVQLEIGVQSTNEVTIREIHRTMKLERLKETVRKIQAGGNIHEHLDLIAGLPYEDYESFCRSFDEIYALKPNQLQLGFLKVLKGSYMYEHAQEYGIVYHDRPPYEVLSTNWLSYAEVLVIKQVEEMLEVYYNSGQFEMTMRLVDFLYESAFDFFRQLGAYYEKMGYFSMSHSRIRRCEILLEFLTGDLTQRASQPEQTQKMGQMRKEEAPEAGRGVEELLDMAQETLLFDLYYRENLKSRPTWAADSSGWKVLTRRYCPNGSLSHVEPFHYLFPGKEQKTWSALPKRSDAPVWVLFDYQNRDPLDHQAKVSYLVCEPADYTVIDLEMTGLSPKTDKIIEIGAVRIKNGRITESYAKLVNPHRSIPERVTELTGITDEMVADAVEEDEAVSGLLDFIGEDIIVGQNVVFDYGFLKQWAANHKRKLELTACDTLKIARKLLSQEQPKNLEALCTYFGIKRENAHRALDDARETAEVFEKLKQLAGETGTGAECAGLFSPKPLHYNAKRQTPATSHQIEQMKRYRAEHGIEDEIHWETLTRNEASRIMDRYYSEYGR